MLFRKFQKANRNTIPRYCSKFILNKPISSINPVIDSKQKMEDIKIYKANVKAQLQLVAVLLFINVVFIALYSKVTLIGWIVLIAISLAILLLNALSSRLVEIQLDEANLLLTLIHRNLLRTLKSATYNLEEIKFSYKRKATTFRGGIKNVCALYLGDKVVAEVIPDFDGWDDSEVHAFVSKLSHLGIERKFVGYTLKDVAI